MANFPLLAQETPSTRQTTSIAALEGGALLAIQFDMPKNLFQVMKIYSLPRLLFEFVCFFLAFTLVALRAVYHPGQTLRSLGRLTLRILR
jgi:hypothetical protein